MRERAVASGPPKATVTCSHGGSTPAHTRSAAGRDLREADHRDDVLFGHVAVVELREEGCHVLGATDLRVVVLDLARRELGEALHLDLVDDGVEDLLPRAEANTAEHRDDLTLLVLLGLVAEADRRGLALRPELIRDDGGVEVQSVHRSPSISTGRRERHHSSCSANRAIACRAMARSPLWASIPGASSSRSHRASATSTRIASSIAPISPPSERIRKKVTTLKTFSPAHV